MSPISWCAICGWRGGVTSPRWRASSARSEDKLEQVLQEVERLQAQLEASERSSGSNGTTRGAASASSAGE